MVSTSSAFLPLRIRRVSSAALWLLHVVVVIPTLVITSNLRSDAAVTYAIPLIFLVAGFSLACIITQRNRRDAPGFALPARNLDGIFIALWVICAALIIFSYGSIMRLSSLEEMYTHRLLYTENAGGLMAYIVPHFANVIAPTLMVLGLARKNFLMIFLGIAGCVIVYAAVASKTAVAIPFAIYALYKLLKFKDGKLAISGLLTISMCVLVIFLTLSTIYIGGIFKTLMDVIVFRGLGVPALTYSQYNDYFQSNGHTNLANIRGIGLFVSAPSSLTTHPDWPELGRMIGDYYYGDYRVRVNANLFSGEGLAAFGAIGVLFVGLVLGAWLRVMDALTKSWSYSFVIVALFPVYNSLTNGLLATTQTSFGGFFWLALLLVYWYGKPKRGGGFATRQKAAG